MRVEVADPARDPALAARLLAVQRAAYRVEAELIGDDRIPALHEDVDDLVAAGLSWLVCRDGAGGVLGAVGWDDVPGEVVVDRLVVDPTAHRRGVGTALVRAVLAAAGARRTAVSTGRANRPACALYERLGFTPVAEAEPVPGLWVTRFEHRPAGLA